MTTPTPAEKGQPPMMLDGWTITISPYGMILRTGMRIEPDRRHRYLRQATISTNVAPIPLTNRLTMWAPADGQARRLNPVATSLAERYGYRRRVFGLATVCRVDELGDPATLEPDQFAALGATVRDIARWQRRG